MHSYTEQYTLKNLVLTLLRRKQPVQTLIRFAILLTVRPDKVKQL
jgi:hypothetical protein